MIPFKYDSYKVLIQNSIFSRFTAPFYQTYSTNLLTEIRDNTFQYFISTPLVFANYEYYKNCYVGDNMNWKYKPIKNYNFTINNFEHYSPDNVKQHRLLFIKDCGNIVIAGCNF